ncbi:hypothetical protein PVA19_04190 [Agrobacterium sp. CNPSo 3708]|uniref:hypothetical protein n=1 Tax=Agrobacterium sp. CNPSo 3708 TaxID=3028150 RepID=UPI0023646202|nr:hypothetical protein [Agrobacterium sp. CNPSo 3708]MDD1497601.1 hypothetical protein [Agrobacterium sp. CNPSo 3708]
MTTVKETTNTTHLVIANANSLLQQAKEAIVAMNAAEARSRKSMAKMVASFVEMGEAYLNIEQVTSAIDAEFVKHGIEPVNLDDEKWKGKNPNVYLPMMSIIDDTWRDVTNSTTGKPVKNADGSVKQK